MLRVGEGDRVELLAELLRVDAVLRVRLEGVERRADEMSDVCTRSSGWIGAMRGACGESIRSRRRSAVSMVACIAAMLRRRLSASETAFADRVEEDTVDVGARVIRRIGAEPDWVLARDSVVLLVYMCCCGIVACSRAN